MGSVTIAAAFVFTVIWDPRAIRGKFLAFTVSLIALGGLVRLLKEVIGRPRPYSFFYPEVSQGKVSVNCIFEMLTANSFPSGHAATVFAAAVILNHFYGQKLLYLYPMALLVAFSRVYTGVHFVSDVLAGILLGTLWGLFSVWVMRNIEARGWFGRAGTDSPS